MNAGYLVKICGLTRREDASKVADLGADFAGFIFHPESPRHIEAADAARFETGKTRRVGVFVRQSVREIQTVMAAARLDFAQLHGDQDEKFCRELGPEKIIKVFWPARQSFEELQNEMRKYEKLCAYFLFDAGSSGGGSGLKIDPQILKTLNVSQKFLLAGGLAADDLDAILNLQIPNLAGFDFNSKVEDAPGIKNHQALEKIFTHKHERTAA